VYEAFYKLRVSPFQLIPDPLFFYDSDTHRHGLVKLRQSIQNGCSITAVTGEPGTGKTELMKKFISEFDPKQTVIANIPLSSLRANNILDYIATAFGVVNMGFVGDALWSKTAFLGKVQQQISSQVSEGKKYVVFIDNAESLSKNCLKKIMQLCSVRIQGAPLVQCFLFGDTSVTRNLKLDVTNLGLHTISSVKLSALAEQETLRYIEHRLLEAGWQGDPEITETAHKLIHDISEGVPWHINLLCHRVFLQSFLEDTHVIDEHIVGMFLTDKQFASMGVSGSDVASTSNVVNIKSVIYGRETKGTSSIPEFHSNISDQPKQERFGARDSISHFFSDNYEVEAAEQIDDTSISIEDVQAAFDASINEMIDVADQFEDAVTGEVFFPEMIDEPGVKVQKKSNDLYASGNVENQAKGTAGVKRDSVLDRILPKVKRGYEELTQSVQNEKSRPRVNDLKKGFKTYPPLDIPAPVQQERRNLQMNHQTNAVLSNEPVDEYQLYARKTSFQTAIRASIVTSLVITLVMWIISDSRSVDTKVAQLTNISASVDTMPRKLEQPVNTVTPSPFVQRDDRTRSREILNK
jgi:type II secretory pathway predicted ATPase ExeA